jgi:hypothetical protein
VPLLGTCGLQRTCRVKRMRRARSPALTSAATIIPRASRWNCTSTPEPSNASENTGVYRTVSPRSG